MTRLVLLAIVVAISLLRAYGKLGRGAARRPPASPPARPATGSPPAASPGAAMTPPGYGPRAAAGSSAGIGTAGVVFSPIEAESGSGSGGLAAVLVAVLVWLGANLALWLCLFAWPPLAALPRSWRLTALALANLFVIALARFAAARVSALPVRAAAAGNDPIGG